MNLPSLSGCRSSPEAEHRHSQLLLLWMCHTSLGTGRSLGCPWLPAGPVGLLRLIWEAHGTESEEWDKNQIKSHLCFPGLTAGAHLLQAVSHALLFEARYCPIQA